MIAQVTYHSCRFSILDFPKRLFIKTCKISNNYNNHRTVIHSWHFYRTLCELVISTDNSEWVLTKHEPIILEHNRKHHKVSPQ